MVGEPRGQLMKTQMLWPLQQAQQVVDKMCCMVLVATMALATQLALVMLSVLQFLAVSAMADPRGPGTAGESDGAASAILHTLGAPHAPGPGGDTAPRVRVLEPSKCILFQEPLWSGQPGCQSLG